VIGIGMIAGSLAGGWLADKSQTGAIVGVLLFNAIVLAGFSVAAHVAWAVTADLFLVGCGIAVVPAFQTRLMDVSADAQTVAAALNHSAFNMANALGAWLGGAAIAAGFGWTSTGAVGSALALAGLALLGLALWLERRGVK
jgi:MFS transporter, DHA1 family, inner membrane transport protein